MGSKPTRQPDAVAPERLAVDALFRTDAVLRQAVTENLSSRLSDAADIAARVEQGWRLEPSLLSAEERGRRHYVAPGTDPSEVLEGVVRQGVEALRSGQTGHTLTLRASAELESIIKHPESTDSDGGVIELGALLDLIASKRVGTVLLAQPAANRLAEETEAESILGAIEQDVSQRRVRQSASSVDGAGEAESDELVERAVNLQMGSATSPEAQLSYRTIPNGADDDEVQQGILQTFQLRPGASDVTSYHDFHTLQIAFEHVWTEIFDGQLATLGRALYREYVKLKVFVGSDESDIEVSTLADLRRLMDEIERLGQVVDEESPGAVREIVETGGRPTGNGDDGWKVAVGVATGGVSYLFEWALQELSKIGQKPIIRWADFPGPWPPRQDRIHVSFATSAPTGSVEIELRTDPGSHIKIIEFQPWDEPSKRFLHGPAISNAGHRTRVTMTLTMSQVAAGVLEFASEESTNLNLGRYVLSDLPDKLVDGTRVTFHWRDL